MIYQSPTNPPQRRWGSALVKITAASVFLIFASACALPSILSTKRGTRFFCNIASKKAYGRLQIESLSLSWIQGQSIEGLSFQDDAGSIFFSCRRITSAASLVSLLFSKDFGDTMVEAPHLKIKKDTLSFLPPVKRHIDSASLLYVPVLTPKLKDLLFPLTGRLTLSEGSVDIVAKPLEPMSIYDMKGSVFFAADRSIVSGHITALSQAQNSTGSLDVQCSLKNIRTFTPELIVNANMQSLPVKVIDQTASLFLPQMKGKITALLGPSISMQLDCHLSQDVVNMQMKASSNTLNIDFSTMAKDGSIVLSSPASFSLVASKELFSDAKLHMLALPQKLLVNGTIENLKIPISQTGIALDKTALSARLQLTEQNGVESSSFSAVGPARLFLDTASLSDGITFSLLWQPSPKNPIPKISFTGSVLSPLDDNRKIDAKLLAQKLPTTLLDAAAGSTIPSALIGKDLDIDASLRLSKGGSQLSFIASSQNLTMTRASLSAADGITLLEPFTCTFTPSDPLYHLISPDEQILGAPSHPLQLNIDRFEMPSISSFKDIKANASLQSSLIAFNRFFIFSPYQIQNFSAEMSIETLGQMQLDVKSSLFSLSFMGACDLDKSVIFSLKPIQATYLLTDAQLLGLFQSSYRPYLTDPANLFCTIEPVKISWKKPLVPQLDLKAKIHSPNIDLQNMDGSVQTSLQQTEASLSAKGADGSLFVDMKSMLAGQSESGSPITCSLSARPINADGQRSLENTQLIADVSVQNLPMQLADAFFSKERLFTSIVGSSLTTRLHFDKTANSIDGSVSCDSSKLKIDAEMRLKGQMLTLNGPKASLSYKLTRDAQLLFDRLITHSTQAPRLQLGQDATILLELLDMQMPLSTLLAGINGRWRDSSLKAKVSCYETSLIDTISKESILLKSTQGVIEKKPGPSDVLLSLLADASTTSANAKEASGVLKLTASVSDIYEEKGQLNFSHPSAKLDMNIQKMPSSVFDMLSRVAGYSSSPFAALFGSSLSATAQLQMKEGSGPVSVSIFSSGARASVIGTMTKGTLTLKEPLYAQVTMTDELSRLLLGSVNPLNISQIRSSSPITLEVQPAGVSIPVTSFSLERLNIPKARLELGQVQCSNEGNLSITLGLLKSVQLSQNKYLNLWFTPIDLGVKNGVINMERADILIADTFDVCLWGKVNPIADKVDMTLGLTADCLAKAFSIGNLPEDYVLQIPLSGSLKDVKLNTGKATAKIAALFAWQQASKAGGSAVGGAAGDLFGQLMNKLGSLPLNDGDTPPAKRPFPWEDSSSSQRKKNKSTKTKKAHLKPTDKPLKQLWEVIR